MKGKGQFGRWAAAALFSAALILGAVDAGPSRVRAAEFSPAAFFQALDRDARAVYAYSARVASDLRLVYDIHARIAELRAEAARTPVASPEEPQREAEGVRCSGAATLAP